MAAWDKVRELLIYPLLLYQDNHRQNRIFEQGIA